MNHRRFFTQLLLITTLTGIALFLLHLFPPFLPYKLVSFLGLLFFAALTTGIYFPAAKAANSSDRNAFTRLVMIFSFVKMIMTVVVVFFYHRYLKPADSFFLVPFFLTYIVFTAFETMFMSKLGKIKPR